MGSGMEFYDFELCGSVFLAPGELTLGRREKKKEEKRGIKIESGLSLSGLNVFVGAGGRRRLLFPLFRWWLGMACGIGAHF